MLKIVFFGTPQFIEPIIKALEENFELIKIIRSHQQWDSEIIEQFRNLRPDFFVVAAYGQILPPEVLEIPKLGTINIHPSLLPHYRGPSPIQSAILNGDEKTGITFFKMDEKIDHGPIIYQFEEEILPNDTFKSLAERLFKLSAENLESAIDLYLRNQLSNQDEAKASYTKLLTKQDGYLDPNSLEIGNLKLEIERAVRAFFPWPGVYTKYQIQDAKYKIIKFLPAEFIQVEGKKPMSYKDFINGYEKGRDFLATLKLI